MKATQKLHQLGQSLWLDNITRDLLTSGTLRRYIDELSVTGLTSNPTIFDHAIKNSTAYDAAIRKKIRLCICIPGKNAWWTSCCTACLPGRSTHGFRTPLMLTGSRGSEWIGAISAFSVPCVGSENQSSS
jgi:Transaldolase/Fructose-6-phosphate aldolase